MASSSLISGLCCVVEEKGSRGNVNKGVGVGEKLRGKCKMRSRIEKGGLEQFLVVGLELQKGRIRFQRMGFLKSRPNRKKEIIRM